jgi:hypothetical protein
MSLNLPFWGVKMLVQALKMGRKLPYLADIKKDGLN